MTCQPHFCRNFVFLNFDSFAFEIEIWREVQGQESKKRNEHKCTVNGHSFLSIF